ncbi:MAG: YkgJ family cysteine cluster protein [Sedimentisphaerales bacterium]|nr:YkgJ family cysteine cluster protein [Sedimentisphaerales bacterium]
MALKTIEKSKKNTWSAKLKRTVTAFLPVDKSRRGSCIRCGACCMLPAKCLFLDFDENHKAVCKIYPIRPLNCRKYPRNESEHITTETCGHTFKKQ